MTLNKKLEHLKIYIIGPMENDDDADREFGEIEQALVEAGIPVDNIMNPCKQEKFKTGHDVMDSNHVIKKLRLANKHEAVDEIYQRIWEVDLENVRLADILIANLPPNTAYVGTTEEATVASIIGRIDLTRKNFTEEQEKIYKDQVRPGLKALGFFPKPVFLVTPQKNRINGTMVYGLVRASGGECFKDISGLIKRLQELYK